MEGLDERLAGILEEMRKPAVSCFVCCDEKYKYYEALVGGVVLMYRRNAFRSDGRKMYLLSDALARVLGFQGRWLMPCYLPRVRYWRRFVSVYSLRRQIEGLFETEQETATNRL